MKNFQNLLKLSVDLILYWAGAFLTYYFLKKNYLDLLTLRSIIEISTYTFLFSASMILFNQYKVAWRYFSFTDVKNHIFALITYSCIQNLLNYFIFKTYSFEFLASTTLLQAFLGSSLRFIYRLKNELIHNRRINASNGKRVLIYGAGEFGRQTLRWLKTNPYQKYDVIGFIDDDPSKKGMLIQNKKVLGGFECFSKILRDYKVKDVFISSIHIRGQRLQEIMNAAHAFKIPPKLFSSPSNFNFVKEPSHLIRPIQLEDLLERKKATVNLDDVASLMEGSSVLITGAGGSIGSAISQQVLEMKPKKLFLLDHSEFNLFEIYEDLKEKTGIEIELVPLLIDLKDLNQLEKIKAFKIDYILHTAAYKHVHLAELNSDAVIKNNILSTLNILSIAQDLQCKKFVLISTDKAVNPKGVMGASKLICENLVYYYSKEKQLPSSIVRFGNVLGSSGSLIPKIKKQIRAGGPITLHSLEMSRYLMLPEEAASLVLKTLSLGGQNETYILEMGKPTKIIDLIHTLLSLMDKSADEIPILIQSPYPGEKITEELSYKSKMKKTNSPYIYALNERNENHSLSFSELLEIITPLLQENTTASNDDIRSLLFKTLKNIQRVLIRAA